MGLFGGKNKIDPNSEHRDWQVVSAIAQESLKEQKRARRWGIFFKALMFLYLLVIVIGVYRQNSGQVSSITEPHAAVVSLDGVIAADQEASANNLIVALRSAFDNDYSKAVILVINSPGGSPVQSGYVYDEIKRLRGEYPDKKLYAVIGDLGASGGYYIASAADEIYADKASLVGSIGVTASSFGFVDTMEKLGVERRHFTSGEHKGFLDPFSPLKAEEEVFWNGVLKSTHEQFIRVVKEGRGDRLKEYDKLFSGLVWNGEQALELGLIDGLGSAAYVVREIVQVDDAHDYTLRPSPFEEFARQFGVSVGKGVGQIIGATVNAPVQLK